MQMIFINSQMQIWMFDLYMQYLQVPKILQDINIS